MTLLDLSAIAKRAAEAKARAEKAMPGPWHIDQNGDGIWDVISDDYHFIASFGARGPDLSHRKANVATALFVEKSRTDVPTLADDVEALSAALLAAQDELAKSMGRVRELESRDADYRTERDIWRHRATVAEATVGAASITAGVNLDLKARAEAAEAKVLELRGLEVALTKRAEKAELRYHALAFELSSVKAAATVDRERRERAEAAEARCRELEQEVCEAGYAKEKAEARLEVAVAVLRHYAGVSYAECYGGEDHVGLKRCEPARNALDKIAKLTEGGT